MNETYRQYLQSDDWKKKRAQKRRGAKSCAICGSADHLDVHHLNYRKLVDVQMCDLRGLCRACHDTAHRLMRDGVLVYLNESHHSRFELTKNAVRKARGIVRHADSDTPASRAIQALASPKGGWTKATLAALGVAWPPTKGWLRRLVAEREKDAARMMHN